MKTKTFIIAVIFFLIAAPAMAETVLEDRTVFAAEENAFVFSIQPGAFHWLEDGGERSPAISANTLEADFVGVGVGPDVTPDPKGQADWSCSIKHKKSEELGEVLFHASVSCRLLNGRDFSGRAFLPIKVNWPERAVGTEQFIVTASGEVRGIEVLSGLEPELEPEDDQCFLDPKKGDTCYW